MGIIDMIGSMFGSSNTISTMKAVSQLLDKQGGINGLVQKFQQGGLQDIVQSWISTGKNLPVNANQIQSVFGNDTIQSLAKQFGVSGDTLSQKISEFLPVVIDKLTPDGKIPSEGITIDKMMAIGKSLFK